MYRKWWWKIAGIVLVAYALYFGLTVPLVPSVSVNGIPALVSDDTATLLVEGHNTRFTQTRPFVYLKKGDTYLAAAAEVKAENDQRLSVKIPMPSSADTQLVNLIVADPKNGYMEFDECVLVLPDPADSVHTISKASLSTPLAELRKFKAEGMFFPARNVLEESIRNLLFHVPMWFSMIFLLGMSWWYSIRYLRLTSPDKNGPLDADFNVKAAQMQEYDLRAETTARTAMVAGVLGCITGMVWAKSTWGYYWTNDPKLNGVLVGMLIYAGYLFLRSTLTDASKRGRIAAVFNVFVFPVFIALIVIMPKLAEHSLHPGSGDTVAVKEYDLNSTLRMFFYPAVIGWIFIFLWMAELLLRMRKLSSQD